MYVYKHQLHTIIFQDIFLDTDNTMGINQMQQKKNLKKKLSGQQTGIIANDCGNICGRKTQDKIRDIYSM